LDTDERDRRPGAAGGGGEPEVRGGALARLLDEAESYCAVQGTQLTQLRRLVLETLLASPGPVKAYDLIDTLRSKGHKLTPATVYRILDFFLQNGLVHRVNALNSFVACKDGHFAVHNPLIIVCPGCQTTTEINDEGLYASIFGRLGDLGYEIKDGTVEVRGVCSKCAKDGREA
jgi:Fur family zinc uptake transcriptional regulator